MNQTNWRWKQRPEASNSRNTNSVASASRVPSIYKSYQPALLTHCSPLSLRHTLHSTQSSCSSSSSLSLSLFSTSNLRSLFNGFSYRNFSLHDLSVLLFQADPGRVFVSLRSNFSILYLIHCIISWVCFYSFVDWFRSWKFCFLLIFLISEMLMGLIFNSLLFISNQSNVSIWNLR